MRFAGGNPPPNALDLSAGGILAGLLSSSSLLPRSCGGLFLLLLGSCGRQLSCLRSSCLFLRVHLLLVAQCCRPVACLGPTPHPLHICGSLLLRRLRFRPRSRFLCRTRPRCLRLRPSTCRLRLSPCPGLFHLRLVLCGICLRSGACCFRLCLSPRSLRFRLSSRSLCLCLSTRSLRLRLSPCGLSLRLKSRCLCLSTGLGLFCVSARLLGHGLCLSFGSGRLRLSLSLGLRHLLFVGLLLLNAPEDLKGFAGQVPPENPLQLDSSLDGFRVLACGLVREALPQALPLLLLHLLSSQRCRLQLCLLLLGPSFCLCPLRLQPLPVRLQPSLLLLQLCRHLRLRCGTLRLHLTLHLVLRSRLVLDVLSHTASQARHLLFHFLPHLLLQLCLCSRITVKALLQTCTVLIHFLPKSITQVLGTQLLSLFLHAVLLFLQQSSHLLPLQLFLLCGALLRLCQQLFPLAP
mmetsp:Transcript_64067/g.105760  ORF Transcript_64067/g.105760 Transcript_64067/m.105760 type:complete len:463 (+) Transcript_64067:2115-3503(+)